MPELGGGALRQAAFRLPSTGGHEGVRAMPLTDDELDAIERQQAETYRTVHRRYERSDGTFVCTQCVTPWPCPQEHWARRVLGDA